MKEIVALLIQKGETISTMESCTGGYVANAITNIEGSSAVFRFGAVTYSNDFKIKMGVNKEIIEDFTVYSMETADSMSQSICKFTDSDYGVGITGQINRKDPNNETEEDNQIYISIYEKRNNQFFHSQIEAMNATREENKQKILLKIEKMLNVILS